MRTPQKADGDLLLDQPRQAERQISLVQQLDEPQRGSEQGRGRVSRPTGTGGPRPAAEGAAISEESCTIDLPPYTVAVIEIRANWPR